MKILIVEDEIIIAEYIKDILAEENFKDLEMAHNTNEAIEKIEGFGPDLILLDINLNGKNDGIELAKKFTEHFKIIFITSQQDQKLVTEAIATRPETYLTKPIKRIDVLAAIQILKEKIENNILRVKDGHQTINLNQDDILYFKAEKNYVEVFTKRSRYTIRMTLKSLEKLTSNRFKRVHKSYLVNMNVVTSYSSQTLHITNIKIPIGRTYNRNL